MVSMTDFQKELLPKLKLQINQENHLKNMLLKPHKLLLLNKLSKLTKLLMLQEEMLLMLEIPSTKREESDQEESQWWEEDQPADMEAQHHLLKLKAQMIHQIVIAQMKDNKLLLDKERDILPKSKLKQNPAIHQAQTVIATELEDLAAMFEIIFI